LSGACSLARTFSPKFGIFFSSTCDIPKRRGKRISGDGNQKQKTALEKPRTSQKPAYETEREEQSKGESLGETRRSSLSKPGRQHECGPEAAAQKEVEKQNVIEL